MTLEYSPFTRRTDTSVRRFIKSRDVLRPGERLVVGVSGGPDSTALLVLLHRIAIDLDIGLTAAHFNHRLRSRDDAAADRSFVEALCHSLDIELFCGSGDVRLRARRQKESVEEAARHLRYRFLGRTARSVAASAVAVGHTLDDRAETVLMHILRGSGLDGLAAMPPRSAWPFGRGPEIVRPLLALSREDIGRYCCESGVEPREDATNAMLVATRNRVRHDVLPLLRDFNPRINEALARLADAVSRDVAFLDNATDTEWRRLAHLGRDSVSFGRADFRALAAALQLRLLRRATEALRGESPSTSQLAIVLDLQQKTGSQLPLPGGIRVSVERERLLLTRGE